MNSLSEKEVIISDVIFTNSRISTIYMKNIFSLNILRCTFAIPEYKGASASAEISSAIIVSTTNLLIEDCIFSNMSSSENGGAIKAEIIYQKANDQSSFVLKNNQFLNSSGLIGGAVYLSVSPSEEQRKFIGTIDSCYFGNSRASTAGGALAYLCDKSQINCSLEVTKSKFINNEVLSSSGSGGAVKYFYDSFTNTNNEFQGNSAGFAHNISGIPSGIVLKSGNKTWNSQCFNINSSVNFHCSNNSSEDIFNLIVEEFEKIMILIYDDNGVLIEQSGTSTATISYNSSTDLIITPSSIAAMKGIIDFDG